MGALDSHGSPSTSIILKKFAECTCLRFSSSAGGWRYRWDLLDNQFVEKNETRRHGGMYFIHSQNFETSHSDIASKKSRLWYTKFFKWIITEIPRNIVCLIVFYLKYATFSSSFQTTAFNKLQRSFLIDLRRLGQGKESRKTILIFFQARVHGLVK